MKKELEPQMERREPPPPPLALIIKCACARGDGEGEWDEQKRPLLAACFVILGPIGHAHMDGWVERWMGGWPASPVSCPISLHEEVVQS